MKYPICLQEKENCFANVCGGCRILSYTSFNKECPFYKTKEQYEEDLIKHPWVTSFNLKT